MHSADILRKNDDFDKVFKSHNYKVSIAGLYIMGRRNEMGFSRLGMVIPKKVFKRAVMRNALRRRLRPQFKEHIAAVEQQLGCGVELGCGLGVGLGLGCGVGLGLGVDCGLGLGLDCVVVATPKMKGCQRQQMSESVNLLLTRFSNKILADSSVSSV